MADASERPILPVSGALFYFHRTLQWDVDVLAVVTDLFFQVRISTAARAAGRNVRYVRTVVPADIALAGVVLVDLDAAVDVMAIIAAIKALADVPIVAFGPHVDTERRKAARGAGADRVLAKSKFVTELPRIMQEAVRVSAP